MRDEISKYAKKGLTPSQIGVILRDSHGIPQVRSITGNKILRILKSAGLAPELPEDLYHLIKKAVNIPAASGQEQEGHGQQVQAHPRGEQSAPSRALLQDQEVPAAHMEV